ncbi:hypothetical protein TTHERM_00628320 (macronuclear) [Tetrahymena thermophila SB210]|uniref:Uncharacterized protein n=1 Tax=Tetrahymena thermophila (strain SB210) TaxID=312017 RepID=Q23RW6_TETTS|nr:hypothetical protein TTHERM_00628320 [Tetrahymena thermophila SB210]EAR99273.1 hypothetical protein TTHERM_00628320 [Tetrahymena thermophila SB210]|eukprot:XP_001019518.1 hypothetical protein TTHERM_00628320 [Tetrahymena thermophila SB210]
MVNPNKANEFKEFNQLKNAAKQIKNQKHVNYICINEKNLEQYFFLFKQAPILSKERNKKIIKEYFCFMIYEIQQNRPVMSSLKISTLVKALDNQSTSSKEQSQSCVAYSIAVYKFNQINKFVGGRMTQDVSGQRNFRFEHYGGNFYTRKIEKIIIGMIVFYKRRVNQQTQAINKQKQINTQQKCKSNILSSVYIQQQSQKSVD